MSQGLEATAIIGDEELLLGNIVRNKKTGKEQVPSRLFPIIQSPSSGQLLL